MQEQQTFSMSIDRNWLAKNSYVVMQFALTLICPASFFHNRYLFHRQSTRLVALLEPRPTDLVALSRASTD